MRYAQLVMGPAGSGKSTYCSTICKYAEATRRVVQVVNLDPAAEHFDYELFADIRELIHLDDAMEDESLKFGPNGGLVYCMEYFIQNIDWLSEQLGQDEDDYILFDCPGQIELYTHLPTMRQLVDTLQNWNFRVCGVFLLDSQFMVETSKFFSGALAALSAMVTLEVPHINVLSKLDLLNKKALKRIGRYLEPDPHLLMEEDGSKIWGAKYRKLSETIGKLMDDFNLVSFMPLNINDEETIENLMHCIDNAIQYGEDLDVRTKDFEDAEPGMTQDSFFDIRTDNN